MPDERGDLRRAVHIATGDRAGATRVRILEHGERQAHLIACRGAVAVEPLHHVPPEVQTLAEEVGRGGHVDLFIQVLADVTDIQIAGLAIERKPPRIAQPIGPDLGRAGRVACEGIVRRNGVAARAIHIQSQ